MSDKYEFIILTQLLQKKYLLQSEVDSSIGKKQKIMILDNFYLMFLQCFYCEHPNNMILARMHCFNRSELSVYTNYIIVS